MFANMPLLDKFLVFVDLIATSLDDETVSLYDVASNDVTVELHVAGRSDDVLV